MNRAQIPADSKDVYAHMGSHVMGIGLRVRGLKKVDHVIVGNTEAGRAERSKGGQYARLSFVDPCDVYSQTLSVLRAHKDCKTAACMVRSLTLRGLLFFLGNVHSKGTHKYWQGA